MLFTERASELAVNRQNAWERIDHGLRFPFNSTTNQGDLPMNRLALPALLGILAIGCQSDGQSNRDSGEMTAETAMTTTEYRTIPFETIDGEPTSLDAYVGNVVLIVNVASKCGFTPQYEGLQALYEKHKESGLVVLGFPANNFGGQEPGTNDEIQSFCTTNYGVSFPMMAKVSVKGDDKHPLFTYLTEESPLPGEIGWNFNKFLLDREGNLVARFESRVKPQSDELVGEISQLL